MDLNDEKCLLEDKSRNKIRAELAQMTFEELQKLKDKIGVKAYNAAMFSTHKSKTKNKNVDDLHKSKNKNGPLEMLAKKPVSRFREIVHVTKKIVRDPRFDSLCGTFNAAAFNNAYSFLNDVKKNDIKSLKKELKRTTDPESIQKIKYLIQRLENKLREEERRTIQEQKKNKEKKEILEALKEGRKPVIMKKSEKKILDLVSQYEDLKNTGKLRKHIKRIRKKNVSKDRTNLLKVDS